MQASNRPLATASARLAAIVARRRWWFAAAAVVLFATITSGVVSILMLRGGAGPSVPSPPLPISLRTASDLQWTRDDSTLAYVSGGDIFTVDAEGQFHRLTSGTERVEGWPRWSPDGKQIAFASKPPRGYLDQPTYGGSLSIMNADGSGYRVVGQGPMTWPPSWSADGKKIAYGADGLIRFFELQSGQTTSYTPAQLGLPNAVYVDAPVWSPARDAMVVYFAEARTPYSREDLIRRTAARVAQGFAVVDANTGQATVLMRYEAPFLPARPAQWAPDGEGVLINLMSPGKYDNPVGLWAGDISGQGLQKIDDVAATQALWSPSGELIAYIDEGTRRVIVLDAQTLQVVDEPGPIRTVNDIAWWPGGDAR